MNTTEFLAISTAICPNKTAIIFEDKRFTFNDLNERTNQLASSLLRLGVKKGDRVALLQVNSNQCVETYFAAAKIGAIYIPLNFRAKVPELTFILNNSEADTLFVGERYLSVIKEAKRSIPALKNVISIDKKVADLLYYEDLIASGSPEDIHVDVSDDDTTILLYTAGTTGMPKGVLLPHKSFSVYVVENFIIPQNRRGGNNRRT